MGPHTQNLFRRPCFSFYFPNSTSPKSFSLVISNDLTGGVRFPPLNYLLLYLSRSCGNSYLVVGSCFSCCINFMVGANLVFDDVSVSSKFVIYMVREINFSSLKGHSHGALIVSWKVNRWCSMQLHFSSCFETLFRNKRFALNEMFQRNTSKFAIFYVYNMYGTFRWAQTSYFWRVTIYLYLV